MGEAVADALEVEVSELHNASADFMPSSLLEPESPEIEVVFRTRSLDSSGRGKIMSFFIQISKVRVTAEKLQAAISATTER